MSARRYRIEHARPEPVEVGWGEVFRILGLSLLLMFIFTALLAGVFVLGYAVEVPHVR